MTRTNFENLMKFHSILFRFTIVIAALVIAPGHAEAAESSFQDSLSGAVLCKRDPLATVRATAGSKSSTFERGIATSTFGEAGMEKNILILRQPIVIAGARTSSIILSLDSSSYFNFSGFVYGIFEGDFESVVKELGLSAAPVRSELRVGKYQRPLVGQNTSCPKTIGLTPLAEKGKFLLGCGWCNGR